MKSDEKGLFWQDVKPEKGGPVREMPKIPKTGWKAPREFPNLASCKTLAIDTETYDPNLLTHGPGWPTNNGHIVGVSVAADPQHAWYFPIRHEVQPEDNMKPKKVLRWLKDILTTPNVTKIGANLLYDLGWLLAEGIKVKGPFVDVLYAEALIDENRFKYDLDSIAKKYLGVGKDTDKLYKWCARYYGGKIDQSQRKNIYRAPPCLAGPYAEKDAAQPFEIYKYQKKLLKKDGLRKLANVEYRLIPLMLGMKARGVRVDIPAAEKARDGLVERERVVAKQIKKMVGFTVNVNASQSLAKAFAKMGLPYPSTEKGNPSFVKTFLEQHSHPIANLVVTQRQVSKARSTFIENYILEKNVNGRLYCDFPQLKGEGGGTVSGRFSSRNPNLQNIPARDPVSKLLIRSCFVPDLGFNLWGRIDLSQIEYRLLAHYAIGKMAKKLRKMYKKDPSTDFHQATTDLIMLVVGLELNRKATKTINFGLVYGMGKSKLQESLGLTRNKTAALMNGYHKSVPFVRSTFDFYMDKAREEGFIETILGRRSRFEQWESASDYGAPALPYESALRMYGPNDLQRAYTHKSLNRLLQGGGADYMKTAMLQLHEDGVFDAMGGPPHITLHDELDFSMNYDHGEALGEVIHVMNNAIKLKVPMLSEVEYGKSWGVMKTMDLKRFKKTQAIPILA